MLNNFNNTNIRKLNINDFSRRKDTVLKKLYLNPTNENESCIKYSVERCMSHKTPDPDVTFARSYLGFHFFDSVR